MPVITTFRSIKSLANPVDQSAIASKMGELMRDAVDAFGREIMEVQTIAGHIYIRLDDNIPNAENFELAYYEIERASI